MAKICEVCGKGLKTGQKIIDVGKVGKRLPFDFYIMFAWDTTMIHLDCILQKGKV